MAADPLAIPEPDPEEPHMQAIRTFPAWKQVSGRPPRRDLLEAVLLYLMTRHSLSPGPGLARGIVYHLRQLLDHPELANTPVDRSAYEELLHNWMLIACEEGGRQESVQSRGH